MREKKKHFLLWCRGAVACDDCWPLTINCWLLIVDCWLSNAYCGTWTSFWEK
jgi:hypothetical protein